MMKQYSTKILKEKKIKTYTLDELTDKYIGKQGTIERERFEIELRADGNFKIQRIQWEHRIQRRRRLSFWQSIGYEYECYFL